MFDKKLINERIEQITEEITLAKKEHKINLPIELIGRQAVYNGIVGNSSSRNQMVVGNLSSSIRINNPTIKKTQTGYEYEFSKTTWSVTAPDDMRILSVYNPYPVNPDSEDIPFEQIITYRRKSDGKVCKMSLPTLKKFHETFATRLVPTENYHKIEKHAVFEKGDVFLKSPSVDDDGFWRYGRELNHLSCSDFAGIEDGIKFSESACKKIAYKTYGKIKITLGKGRIPLNIYGDKNTYKIMPDVGEFIGEDRIVIGARMVDPMDEMISMSPHSLSKEGIRYDGTDELHYIRPGETNARVINIDVQYQSNPSRPSTPKGVDDQLFKYVSARTSSSIRALQELREIEKQGLPIDPEYSCFGVNSISDLSILSHNDLQSVGMSYYKDILAPKLSGSSVLSEFEVVITYEADYIPSYGQKVTGHSGNKSVITAICKDEEMYRDKDGNVADCVSDNLSTIKRTNSYTMYEPGFNAMLRDVSKYALESIGFSRNLTEEERSKILNHQLTDDQYKIAFDIYDEYLSCGLIINRLYLWEALREDPESYKEDIARFLLPEKQFNLLPIDNPYPFPWIGKMMLDKFEDILVLDTLTFIQDGVKKETKTKALIGSAYFMILDRPGNDYQAVSTSHTNHYNLPAKLASGDKTTSPIKTKAIRTAGESEERLHAAVNDDLNTSRARANIRNYTDNVHASAEVVKNAIKDPLKLPIVSVDRTKVPVGTSSAASIVRHILYSQGIKFERVPKTKE